MDCALLEQETEGQGQRLDRSSQTQRKKTKIQKSYVGGSQTATEGVEMRYMVSGGQGKLTVRCVMLVKQAANARHDQMHRRGYDVELSKHASSRALGGSINQCKQ